MNYLILGGSTGIGLELTKKLLSQGHQVYVASRTASQRIEPAENLKIVDLDATDSDADWSFLPEELHGIAYSVGTINLKPFKRLKSEDFLNDFSVNLLGAVNTIQAALPALKKSGSASVVLFSSVAAQRGLGFHASVAAAKGAVEGLTRALSAELAPEIRVNAIALSLTDTPLAERLLNTDAKKEAGGNRHALKRIGRPEDAAALADLLIGEQGSWITGQVIGLDGGMSTVQNL